VTEFDIYVFLFTFVSDT